MGKATVAEHIGSDGPPQTSTSLTPRIQETPGPTAPWWGHSSQVLPYPEPPRWQIWQHLPHDPHWGAGLSLEEVMLML